MQANMFITPSGPSTGAFVLLCLGVVVAFLAGVWRSAKLEGVHQGKRTATVASLVVVWLWAISVIGSTGWVEARPMPRLMVLFATVNLVSLAIGLSRIGRWLAESIPIS